MKHCFAREKITSTECVWRGGVSDNIMRALACALLLLFCAHAEHNNAAAGSRIAAYMPEWRFGWEPERWNAACRYITDLILFSVEVGHDGSIQAQDRLPTPDQMSTIRAAADRHGTRVLICFGGNSRTRGFSTVVQSPATRKRFVSNLRLFLEKHEIDGVDYNWEYPSSAADWKGLINLARETRAMLQGLPFRGARASSATERPLTMAYYPDGHQERILASFGAASVFDLLHSMSYDAPHRHSTFQFALDTIARYDAAGLPRDRLCLGVPFYARSVRTGEWKTYAELADSVEGGLLASADTVGEYFFNGRDTIARKATLAKDRRLGGIMIWELGQDLPPSAQDALLPVLASALGYASPDDKAPRDEL